MPRISVCLPTFNGERFLAEAIESVLCQTFSDFELVLIDDCSTDGTWELVQQFAKSDSRIRALRNTSNKGLFENYNECMSHASGDLIKLFAQDDVWDCSILEKMAAPFLSNESISLVVSAREWIDEDGTRIPLEHPLTEFDRLDGKELIRRCLLSMTNWVGEPSTVMFPRKFVGAGFDTNYYHLGDLDYWFRVVANGECVFIREPLCRFRRHAASTTSKNLLGLRFAIDMLRLTDIYSDFLIDCNRTPEEMKLYAMGNAGNYVGELARRGEISVADLLAQDPDDASQARRMLDEYRQLSYYALLSLSQREEAWSARFADMEKDLTAARIQLANVLESRCWKSSSLLRSAVNRVRGIAGVCR